MQYVVQKGEKGKIEVKVDVPQAGFEEAYKSTLDSHVKSSNISGFRPGMAPADVVEKHVGVSRILNDAASFLVNKHLSEIFEKEKFFPIDSPKISVDSLAQGSPFSFVVSFVQKPVVKVGDWKSLKIAKIPTKEVGDVEINDSIKNIYEAWKKSKAAQGQQAPEENEGKYIYDAQGNKVFLKDDEGKDKKITAEKIDDEFARAIGARDLAHLKEIVKGDLERIVADRVEMKFEEEIFEKLAGISEVEIPEILIEDELNRILVRLTNNLEQQGKELDTFLKEEKTTIDELKTKWRKQAEQNVKVTLIMDEIGREAEIKVSREEIEQTAKGMGQSNLTPEQKADLERYLALSIFQAKTLDFVKKTISAS